MFVFKENVFHAFLGYILYIYIYVYIFLIGQVHIGFVITLREGKLPPCGKCSKMKIILLNDRPPLEHLPDSQSECGNEGSLMQLDLHNGREACGY